MRKHQARTHTRATMKMLAETHKHYQGNAECIYWAFVCAASNAFAISATLLLQRKPNDNASYLLWACFNLVLLCHRKIRYAYHEYMLQRKRNKKRNNVYVDNTPTTQVSGAGYALL